MNVDKPPKYVSVFIEEIEKGIVLNTTKEARVYIDKLTKMLMDQSI